MISVLLPVYNGLGLLEYSVESVLQQEYTDWELLILDDASTDSSWNFINNINNPRVSKFRNVENKGLFYNLNFLIKKSKGEIIKLWSQDDIMYQNCLAEINIFHQRHPDITFSYSDRVIINARGEILNNRVKKDITPEIISPDIHQKIFSFTGSIAGNIANVAINRWALNKYGLFREDMKFSADLDMWERLTEHDNIGRIAVPLIKLRDHDGQLSRKKGYMIHQIREDNEIFERRFKKIIKSDLKDYAELCRKWKREVYYMAVFLNLIKNKNFSEAKLYQNELTKKSPLIIIFIRFILIRLNIIKSVSLKLNLE